MLLLFLHAGGIGWDEILVSVIIAGVVAFIAFRIDRGRDVDADHEPDESLTGPEREQDKV